MRLVLAALVLAACASAPPPRPAALDPSDPAGPRSPEPPLPTAFDTAPFAHTDTPAAPTSADDTHGHGTHAHGTHDETPPPAPATTAPASPAQPTAEQAWTCPMHPEIRSHAPGRCPKCGMKLVPAKPSATDPDHAHEHGSPP